ncbi:MAG TPA: beta-phosphoglucomutase family hydrolase [Jatrophihabitantaceae bacterium]|nr:beta-phosphoglucomutase family hydrolase [Jatrophihabitantaceae bacterium]
MLGLPDHVAACLFDLDGVLTDTASVHRAAWKETFDAYLSAHGGAPFTDDDYDDYVDGKPRADGVRDFLASRGIQLPEGQPDDPPGHDTVHGIGNRKNELLLERIHRDGVTVYEGSRRYLALARDAGLARAVVSSSANAVSVLKVTGLDEFIQAVVDGNTIEQKRLPGKPAPDSFLAGAELLHVAPGAAAVFEDALAGVAAGRAGHFGFVVGVNRLGADHERGLREHGADTVVADLADLA